MRVSLILDSQCCGDKITKEWMRFIRLGLEFRMKLTAHEPAVTLDLNDLNKVALDINTGHDQSLGS